MKKTIICIDDEKIVLDSLRNELKSHLDKSYFVEIAETGQEALSLIDDLLKKNHEIPLIIADYIMPGMKGDELLIAAHAIVPKTKKMLLTGQATTEGVTNAVNKAGLYRYIAKPWQTDDMILTISEALKIFEAEKQLEERRKELEVVNKKLSALDRSKTYFIMLLAHELKTPILSISGFNEVLKEAIDDPNLREFCNDIEESTKRLKKFTDYSLLILELLNEIYPLNIAQQDFYYLVNNVLEVLQPSIVKKNIKVEKQFNFEKMDLFFDAKLIQKVVEIVIDNSIKYSNKDSEILITDSLIENIYTISIIDNGSGFSPETLKNLFKFFVSDDIMHHSVGYGLGLAMAKLIMDAHKSSIVIANREKGAIVNLIFTKKNQ